MKIVSKYNTNSATEKTPLRVVRSIARQRLIVVSQDRTVLLRFEDIVYCQADGNYSLVFTQDGQSYLVTKCLKHVVGQIPSAMFIRIHQSYVVNVDSIHSYSKDEVTLYNKRVLPLSRRSRKDILNLFSGV